MGQFLNHPKHGPLPAVLLTLTVVTGIVDAVSIIGLGTVFVANMTGNVVFIGFALAGVPAFSFWGSLVALIAFLVGAGLAGAVITRRGAHRGRLLRDALAAEVVLFSLALAVVLLQDPLGLAGQLIVIALAAIALGIQNAAVRHLGVPDITTTVLTMTLTGIGADLRRGDGATALRRIIVVAAMLVGAVIGALLMLHLGIVTAAATIVAVLALVLLWSALLARGARHWHRG